MTSHLGARSAALAALVCSTLAGGQAWAAPERIVEGTEFPIRFEDSLSSKTNTEGDRFTISLADDVKLSDGTVIPAGSVITTDGTILPANNMMMPTTMNTTTGRMGLIARIRARR